jgi:hypothetical protein
MLARHGDTRAASLYGERPQQRAQSRAHPSPLGFVRTHGALARDELAVEYAARHEHTATTADHARAAVVNGAEVAGTVVDLSRRTKASNLFSGGYGCSRVPAPAAHAPALF